MKFRKLIAGIVALVCVGTFVAFAYGAARSRNLGHGYRIVHREVDTSKNPNAFEGIAHYNDLYFHATRIGTEIGELSISPSGNFAFFEQDGKLMLFDRQSKKAIEVTDGEFAVPEDIKWNEVKHEVNVTYYEQNGKKHRPSMIKLPTPINALNAKS
jgi:hypothetical protein